MTKRELIRFPNRKMVPNMNSELPDFAGPDEKGHFGPYGGRFVAETLMQPLEDLRAAYEQCIKDPDFLAELDADLAHYVGRPSPPVSCPALERALWRCAGLSQAGGSESHRRTQGKQHHWPVYNTGRFVGCAVRTNPY